MSTRFRLVAIGAVGSLALSACGGAGGGGGSDADGPVTFVAWGGQTQEIQMASWAEPFGEDAGVRVLSDGPMDYAKLKAQVDSKRVSWDVVVPEPWYAIRECGTMLEPIDTAIVDTSKMPEGTVTECSVPAFLGTYFLAYSGSKFTDAPQNWADFFDIEKFPGKRALYNYPTTGALESALLADGVAEEDLYPLDLDRAFAKLDSLGDDLVFYNTGVEQQQMMETEEVAMLHAWTNVMLNANRNDANFKPVWTDNFLFYDTLAVPKGAKTDLAMELIARATSPEGQSAFVEELPYGVINSDAQPNLSDEFAEVVPSRPEISEESILVDQSYYAEHFDEVYERWTAFTGG